MTAAAAAALIAFIMAYVLVLLEDFTKLRKSKPLLLAAGFIWVMVALEHDPEHIVEGLRNGVYEFGQLFLFILVAVTYISAIRARGVFESISTRILQGRKGLRQTFWVTGAMAFVLSPIADNMTTALILGALVVAIGRDQRRFTAITCTNIVVAANAGGAFSPFGDLTTLMVWQAGKVQTPYFFWLVAPSLVSWLIPAFVMQFGIKEDSFHAVRSDIDLERDWLIVVGLFAVTVLTAIIFHSVLHIPPFLGMTTGLGYYMVYCYWNCRRRGEGRHPGSKAFEHIQSVEWDTMLFFFGVIPRSQTWHTRSFSPPSL